MKNEEDYLFEKADREWQKQEEQQAKWDEHEKYLESLSDEDREELRLADAERKRQIRIKRNRLPS
ncbi:hypothetical protein [Mucilaginibacter kameinonensis]|uniref:hypothetical protein n=1 Tax=Mucilaginibacter kameinonensis TaxID=452286 RepID=UPI000EF7CDEB|nr:hypothetical protein [Mucilaginibacter kameinonensis]